MSEQNTGVREGRKKKGKGRRYQEGSYEMKEHNIMAMRCRERGIKRKMPSKRRRKRYTAPDHGHRLEETFIQSMTQSTVPPFPKTAREDFWSEGEREVTKTYKTHDGNAGRTKRRRV